jgi:hypothetical protein
MVWVSMGWIILTMNDHQDNHQEEWIPMSHGSLIRMTGNETL